MRKLTGVLLVSLTLLFSSSALWADAKGSEEEITGKVTSIDGNMYMITDLNGMKHTLTANDKTEVKGDIAVGSNVEAYVDGTTITKLKLNK